MFCCTPHSSSSLTVIRPLLPLLTLQCGKLLHLATSAEHVAVACSSGEIRLYGAASMELAGVVPALPLTAAPGGRAQESGSWPEACAFSRDGLSLTASYSGGQLATWDVTDLSQPAIVHLRQFHRCLHASVPACLPVKTDQQCSF